jgi:hypothetical protein
MIRMDLPLRTVKAFVECLEEHRGRIPALAGDRRRGSHLMMNVLIERDRIRHLQRSMEKINGVLSLELLESKGGLIG